MHDDTKRGNYMLKQHFQTKRVVGSDVTLMIVSDMPDAVAEQLLEILWGIAFRFERQFSRFIPESELSLFNRTGGRRRHISPAFRELLLAAKSMTEVTGGLYNPFILPALQRAGYTKSFMPGHENDVQDDYSNRLVVSVDNFEVGDEWAKIPYGTSIDMGGCGKGYLADQLAACLPDEVVGFWFSLGGDIVAGGHDENRKPWTVRIADSSTLDNLSPFIFQPINFDTFAVATSDTNVRRGTSTDTKDWHHIIDPRTERPSMSDVRVASVYCDKGIDADVLASCAVILGSEKAVPFLKSRNVRAALLQTYDGKNVKFGRSLRLNKNVKAVAHA